MTALAACKHTLHKDQVLAGPDPNEDTKLAMAATPSSSFPLRACLAPSTTSIRALGPMACMGGHTLCNHARLHSGPCMVSPCPACRRAQATTVSVGGPQLGPRRLTLATRCIAAL